MTRLAIVGASVRAAVQSALRAGFDVVGADLFADADLDGVCPIKRVESYPDDLVAWLAKQDIDAWMYTGALENYPDLVDEMAEIAPLWGVSGESLRRCRDPMVLQSCCHQAGVRFPETRRSADIPSNISGWLARSLSGGSGAGIAWLDAAVEAEFAQRHIPGRYLSAAYVVAHGRASLLGLSNQLVGEPFAHANEWSYCGSIGPIEPTDTHRDDLCAIGELLADQLGLVGAVGVDLVESRDGHLTVIEINPRYTASFELWEQLFGVSAVAEIANALQGGLVDSWPVAATHCIGKLVLFAKLSTTVSEGFSVWLQAENAEGRVADIPRAGELISVGRPICTLIDEAPNAERVRDCLRNTADEAERLLYADCEPR